MSMVIPNAYLFKKNADFNDLNKCIAELVDLKKKYHEWLLKEFAEHDYMNKDVCPTGDYKTDWSRIRSFGKMLKKRSETAERAVGFDLSFNAIIYCRPVNGVNFIVVQFFPGMHANQFLRTKPINWPEYWYTNQCTDGCEDIPDYPEREEFWEGLFEKSGIPSENGFNFELIPMADWDFMELAHDIYDVIKEKQEKESKNANQK